jgi:hypothetical protein
MQDEYGDENDGCENRPWLGSEVVPDDRSKNREDHHRGDEVAGDGVDDALDRRLRSLGVLHHQNDGCKRGVLSLLAAERYQTDPHSRLKRGVINGT